MNNIKNLEKSSENESELLKVSDVLSLLENDKLTDELISRILDTRLQLEKNKFKVVAVSIILKRLERAKKLLDSLDKVEDEIFSNRIFLMNDNALVNLYKEMNQNVKYLVEVLNRFDEIGKTFGTQVNVVNQIEQVRRSETQTSSYVDINAAEALRRLSEILGKSKKEETSVQDAKL